MFFDIKNNKKKDINIEQHKNKKQEKNEIKYVCVPKNYCPDNYDRRVIYCIPVDKEDLKKTPIFLLPLKLIYCFLEYFLSLIALILTFPITLIVALLIRLDSPGNPFFIQRRVSKSIIKKGKDLQKMQNCSIEDPDFSPDKLYWFPQTFNFIKIRTMYVDAKQRFSKLYAYDYTKEYVDTFAFKVQNDPRVTRVGKWLRESTIDELLNFCNVVTGQIHLVGPRPELPEMLVYYNPIEMLKFTVKPGITGLPQIKGRGRLSFKKTKTYDLEYVKKRTLFLDIKIIFITIWKVITRHGSF